MSPNILSALDASRLRAATWLLHGCLILSVLIGGAAMLLPIHSVFPGVLAFSATAIGYWAVRTGYKHYRLIVGQSAVAQAIALTAALSGTGWQIDAHMLFYVALAALVGLVDIRAILGAAGTVVLHHLSMGIFLPYLVFPSVNLLENIERVLFHGTIVGLEVLILCWAVSVRLGLTQQVQGALIQADSAILQAKAAEKQADQARAHAEAEAERAHIAQAKAEEVLGVLKTEQAAREQANLAALQAEERTAAEQQKVMEAQTQVVKALKQGMERIARGDLSNPIVAPFPGPYEALRVNYNRAIADLASTPSDVSGRTGDLLSQVAGVSAAANDLAGRTDKQVASLAATSDAVTRLHEAVAASTNNAKSTAASASAATADAVAGGEVVRQVVGAMSEIEASSQEIAKINAVMDSIAFQTNLLALNAGVEAARAGTAGRGFSVVASEVRALSQRATEAARGINELTQRSGRQVQAGVLLVGRAGEALDGIVASIAEMTASVEQIASAADAQSNGLRAVDNTVAELDAVAQSNAAMFEETSTACLSLTAGMDQIAEQLRRFRMTPQPASVETLAVDDGHVQTAIG
ncbi:MAG: methyl-accepting chemotaxis protein [Pseudomonadota bacterium]